MAHGDPTDGSGGPRARLAALRRRLVRTGGPGGPPRGRARPRTRALLRWLGLVALLAAGLVFLFFYSAAFVVKDVQVTGGRDEVQQSALSLAQIPQGRPLAKVSETRVSERVLADPRIAAVQVDREWPSGVVLTLTEREPALALRGGGETWLADASGEVYERDADPSSRLPLITLRDNPAELDRPTVTGLAELWRLRPDPAELEGDLAAPRVDRAGEVTMQVGRVKILWGAPTENDKKWQVVRALIGQETIDPEGERSVTIDVRLPDTPVVTGLPEQLG